MLVRVVLSRTANVVLSARRRRPAVRAAPGLHLAIGFLILAATSVGGSSVSHSASVGPRSLPTGLPIEASLIPLLQPLSQSDPLTLNVSVTPGSVCIVGAADCGGRSSYARVTLTAQANYSLGTDWNAVQIAFVLETTPYDGMMGGVTNCGTNESGTLTCGETGSVPYFLHNASQIVRSIQASHPLSNMSFALAFEESNSANGDGDGYAYYPGTPNFTGNATRFGYEANSAFTRYGGDNSTYALPDSDFSDNLLDSASITGIYGAMVSGTLNWSPVAHHVIAWIGTGAPDASGYEQNDCVFGATSCPHMTPNCEPSFTFTSGNVSPNCLGWISSQDVNATHSLAALATRAPACSGSLGWSCTVDIIDLNATPTDPYSRAWTTTRADHAVVLANVNRTLGAGCDLANATGGSWDGPSFFACPDGRQGTLDFVPRGSSFYYSNLSDPTFAEALAHIGVGVGFGTIPGLAPVSGQPMFEFVPYGNVTLAPTTSLNATASCDTPQGSYPGCQIAPTVLSNGNRSYLAWNWSQGGMDALMAHDARWSASFNVRIVGPPFGTIPVDACSTTDCVAVETHVTSGFGTRAEVQFAGTADEWTGSFHAANVTVAAPGALMVDFISTPGIHLPNSTIAFTLLAPTAVLPGQALWSFGDQSPDSTVINPSHLFERVGDFSVEVTLTDRLGRVATAQRVISVLAVPGPLIVGLNGAPIQTTVGRPVTLSGSASGGLPPISLVWAGLPPGCPTVNGSTMVCRPSVAGSYTIQLQASDSVGQSGQSQDLPLLVNPAPTIGLTWQATPECTALAATWVGFTPSVIGGTPGYTVTWNFGDGSSNVSVLAPTHSYAVPGSYSVYVEVIDSVGASANNTTEIQLTAPACAPSTPASTGSPSGVYLAAALVVAAAAVAGVILAIRRRPPKG